MNDEQQQKILKHLNQIKKNIEDISPYVDHVDGVSKYMTSAKFDLLTVCHLLKKSNQKVKDGKEEIVQHKDEEQEIRS